MKNLFGEEEIRYLGFKNPFASLMLPPFLKVETRTWNTEYRGLVLITASKKPYHREQYADIAGDEQYKRICKALDPDDLFDGFAIGVGRLVNTRLMTKADENSCFVQYREPWRARRKDGSIKTQQLYCHFYADQKPIKPFEIKGAQGWRKLDQETISKIQLL